MEGIYGNPNITVYVGDVIFFEASDGYVIHRVVNMVEKSGTRYYETRGDNNLRADRELVLHSQVVGRLLRVIERPQGTVVSREVDEYERAYGVRDSLMNMYENELAAYQRSVEEYKKLEADYQAGKVSYQQLTEAYAKLEQKRLALNVLRESVNEANRRWKCIAMTVFPDVYAEQFTGTDCAFS